MYFIRNLNSKIKLLFLLIMDFDRGDNRVWFRFAGRGLMCQNILTRTQVIYLSVSRVGWSRVDPYFFCFFFFFVLCKIILYFLKL